MESMIPTDPCINKNAHILFWFCSAFTCRALLLRFHFFYQIYKTGIFGLLSPITIETWALSHHKNISSLPMLNNFCFILWKCDYTNSSYFSNKSTLEMWSESHPLNFSDKSQVFFTSDSRAVTGKSMCSGIQGQKSGILLKEIPTKERWP